MIFDYLSIGFLCFVFFIRSIVIMYRKIYMGGDLSSIRFIILVNLFILSIILLVISPSIIRIILGWDGLGVISFLLVIYYQNLSSLKSGLITIYTNRLGDVTIIISIYFIWITGGFSNIYLWNSKYFFILIFLLLFTAITKSAQIPFSAWLPAAIAAPTPVSSLVHSSTLVTAGVYLTLRFYYSMNTIKYSIILINISLITCLLSGLVACTETDFKKVVAISTLRQLGLIIYCISILELKCGFFHIVCHAIFKALLFLRCGLLIKLAIGRQDRRFKGGVSFITIFINTLFLLARIRLLGFPFLTGFYSKDRILEYSIIIETNLFIIFILIVCCILTFIYRIRLFFVGIKMYWSGYKFIKLDEIFYINLFLFLIFLWIISFGKLISFIIFYDNIIIISLEKLSRILILTSGFYFSLIKIWNKFNKIFLKTFLSEISFINWLIISFFRKISKKYFLILKTDSIWLEILGPKEIYNKSIILSNLIYFNKIFIFKWIFILIFFIILVFYIFIYSLY